MSGNGNDDDERDGVTLVDSEVGYGEANAVGQQRVLFTSGYFCR